MIVHKYQALGQHLPLFGKQRHHVDPRLQRTFVDEGYHLLIVGQVHRIIIIGVPTRGDAQSQNHAIGLTVAGDDGLQLTASREHIQRVAAFLGLGQIEAVGVARIGQSQFQSLGQFFGIQGVGSERKDTPAGIVGLEIADAVATAYQGPGHVQCPPFSIMSLESHTSRHVAHQIAAFGIEVNQQAVLDGRSHCRCSLRQSGHTALGELSAVHLLIDREYTAEDAGVALQIALHAVAPLPLGLDAVHAPPSVRVAGGEIEHPCRIGSHLVEAGVQRVCQVERTMRLTVQNDYFLCLHRIADGVQQFDVEDAAHIGVMQVVVTHHIGFVPDILTFIIGRIIEMNVNTLRREQVRETFEILLPFEQQRVGVGSCQGRREAYQPEC